MDDSTIIPASVIDGIASRADQLDQAAEWPSRDLVELAAIGAMRWAIPEAFGGSGFSPLALHERYEQIATASLSTALILTQRDSAVQLLAASDNAAVRDELLPAFASGEKFATVGIAQLTTSRQRGGPALIAHRESHGWRLTGTVPWSTGAAQASHVVVGAAAAGSSAQLLIALRRDAPGVRVDPPMALVALASTHTTSIYCDGAFVDDRSVIKGPVENVLAGRKNTLPAGQAFLAMGLCHGAIELIGRHDSDMARSTAAKFGDELRSIRQGVLQTCDERMTPDPTRVAQVRGQCNDLAVRVTHAAVAIYKGSALLAGHPAQRLAREAMFLLVWSCPNPVIDCTVEMLAGSSE